MKCILGRKMNMTQVHTDNGMVIPVTVVKAGPCVVSQVKTTEKDGYAALQLSFGQKKGAHKPQRVHGAGLAGISEGHGAAFTKEIRVASPVNGAVRGAVIMASTFAPGDSVAVTGWSKGKGFAGVVKRHHFHGHPTTHGHKDQERMPGSIGSGGVQHVFRGQRMAGRMGNDQVTVHGLEIVAVDAEKNRLLVKGSLPGSMNSFVVIVSNAGDMTFGESPHVPLPTTTETAPEQGAAQETTPESEEEKVI